jgi:hypothetical protein
MNILDMFADIAGIIPDDKRKITHIFLGNTSIPVKAETTV